MKTTDLTTLFDKNIAIWKNYNGRKQKIVLCHSLRKKGFELNKKKKPERCTVNTEKLDQSLSRTKSTIHELALCNNWDYWVTLTLNPKKWKRDDLKAYQRALGHFINNYNSRTNANVKYILVPEMHKDGNWHMHGLIKGLPLDHLTKNKYGYWDWKPYSKKFGYMSIDTEIRNHEAVAKYIVKYITKDLSKSVKELNANMYYCSKGLIRAQEMKRGKLTSAIESMPTWDYVNDYCSIKWYEPDEVLDHIIE